MPNPPSYYGKVDELPQARRGVVFSTDGHREYTRTFLVMVTEKLMGPLAVCQHPLLPLPWSFYYANGEYDTQALLTRYEAVQRDQDDWQAWLVTATYSTQTSGDFQAPPTGGGPGGFPTNPSNAFNNPEYEHPDISWNFEEQQKPALVDLDNKLYQNSAKQPFTPPVTFPRAYQVLNITRNEISFSPTVAEEYAYAVNDAEFLGYPAGFVQCMPPQAHMQWKGQTRYYRVTYKLKIHPRNIWLPTIDPEQEDEIYGQLVLQGIELNWQPVLQDQGYMRIEDGVDANGKKLKDWGKPVAIMRNNQPIQQQVLLNGAGQVQDFINPVTLQLVPYFIQFRQFPEKDFNSLLARGFV